MAGKKRGKPEQNDAGASGSARSMRDAAEKKLPRSPMATPKMEGKTPEELIHELQVHQVELETQAEELRRAQLELGESRDQYLDLYEFAPVGYLTLTDRALVSQANLTAAVLLGTERNRLVGVQFRKYIVPEDLETWDRYFSGILQEEKRRTAALTIKRGDGSAFPARLEGVRLTGKSDGTTTVRVAVSDISDIRQAEEALRESEIKLRTIIDILPVGISVLDAERRIVYENPALQTIVQMTPEGLKRENYKARTYIRPDGSIMPPEEFASIRATREHKTIHNVETGIVPEDGRVIWTDVSAVPVALPDWKVVVITDDITVRKGAEERIRWLASFPEMNPNPVIEMDAQGTITFANAATHRILRELGLRDDPALFVPDDKEEILRLLQKTDVPEVYREIVLNRETFAENIALNHELHVARMYALNITGRRRAEEALHETNQKLSLLSGITRHDINNQLTALKGFLNIFEKKLPGPEFRNYFRKIADAADRISAMIQFTKTYESIGVNAPVWQNPSTLVDTAVKDIAFGNVRLENNLSAGTEIFADPLIVKVFYNLMDNAVRYGGKITTIRFFGQESGDELLIVCEDDGDGIPADEKEKIFDRGFGKNTGLGLLLSREILAITGITIRENGEQKKGARFEIMVPEGMWRRGESDGKRDSNGNGPRFRDPPVKDQGKMV